MHIMMRIRYSVATYCLNVFESTPLHSIGWSYYCPLLYQFSVTPFTWAQGCLFTFLSQLSNLDNRKIRKWQLRLL